jgi:hypothetical protein
LLYIYDKKKNTTVCQNSTKRITFNIIESSTIHQDKYILITCGDLILSNKHYHQKHYEDVSYLLLSYLSIFTAPETCKLK